MKEIKLFVVFFALIMFVSYSVLVSYSAAWKIPIDIFKKTDIFKKSDNDKRSKVFANSVVIANINFAMACQSTLLAAGKSEDAERLGKIIADMQKNRDDYTSAKKFEETLDEIKNATKKMKSINYSKDLNYSIARKEVGKALLFFGIATYFDTQAVNKGKDLAPDLTREVKKDPLNYIKLNNYLSFVRIVATNIPNQLIMIENVTKNLIRYAKSKGCKVPSKNKINKEIEKQRPDACGGV